MPHSMFPLLDSARDDLDDSYSKSTSFRNTGTVRSDELPQASVFFCRKKLEIFKISPFLKIFPKREKKQETSENLSENERKIVFET